VEKIPWSGRLVSIQPRILLLRSFDQRHHSYQGYVLRVNGTWEDQTGEFLIAVGQGAHEKHRLKAGMELSGQSVPVDAPRMETAGFYKTSGLKVVRDVEGGPLCSRKEDSRQDHRLRFRAGTYLHRRSRFRLPCRKSRRSMALWSTILPQHLHSDSAFHLAVPCPTSLPRSPPRLTTRLRSRPAPAGEVHSGVGGGGLNHLTTSDVEFLRSCLLTRRALWCLIMPTQPA